MSEKDKPNSSKFVESVENSSVFRPRAWATFKTACPTSLPCATLVPIVAAEGKRMRPPHRHDTELREDGCVESSTGNPIHRQDPELVLFRHGQ